MATAINTESVRHLLFQIQLTILMHLPPLSRFTPLQCVPLLLWGDPLLRPLSLPLPFAISQRDRKFVLASLDDDDDVSVTSTPEYSPPLPPVAVAALGQVLCKCWHDLGPLLVSLF